MLSNTNQLLKQVGVVEFYDGSKIVMLNSKGSRQKVRLSGNSENMSASIAEWIEHLPNKHQVAGSIPAAGSGCFCRQAKKLCNLVLANIRANQIYGEKKQHHISTPKRLVTQLQAGNITYPMRYRAS
ncbi:hypothetical protein EVAR_64908_1 [Eumeta japonica]|uniref:Uncharacterized protein n=1 Tax=Eumeta variegata TaxID=151549 RepID=A0A4C2A1S9_EUMVA|nr:hypothetical protein EVAR_64908_1 [Eumeta japonica]